MIGSEIMGKYITILSGFSVVFNLFTATYAKPDNAADRIPISIHFQAIEEGNGPELFAIPKSSTPKKAIKIQIHCPFLIFSESNMEAKNKVKMGAKYCNVEAIAIGNFCMVKKNNVNANIPATPLKNNHFLLFPNIPIFFLLNK